MTSELSDILPQWYIDEDRSQSLLNVGIAFIILETIVVGLFLWVRVQKKTANSADVWCIVPGYFLCISQCIALILLVTEGGAGRHMFTLSMDQIVAWLKIQVADEFTYPPACVLPKISILLFYLRIFQSRYIRVASFVTMAICVAFWIGMFATALAICTPFAYNWDRTIEGGHCGEVNTAYRMSSVPNVATDIMILIIPLPRLWRLNMGLARKIGVILTFMTGSFGLVTATIRMISFFTSYINVSNDITWTSVDRWIWTCIEPGVYLIAACLPSLVPLLKKAGARLGLDGLPNWHTPHHYLHGYSSSGEKKAGVPISRPRLIPDDGWNSHIRPSLMTPSPEPMQPAPAFGPQSPIYGGMKPIEGHHSAIRPQAHVGDNHMVFFMYPDGMVYCRPNLRQPEPAARASSGWRHGGRKLFGGRRGDYLV